LYSSFRDGAQAPDPEVRPSGFDAFASPRNDEVEFLFIIFVDGIFTNLFEPLFTNIFDAPAQSAASSCVYRARHAG
jgi:hypothetical protein